MKKTSLSKVTVAKNDRAFLILFYPELIGTELKNIQKGADKNE